MANYLERVAAAGARVGSQTLPAVTAPPRLPNLRLPSLANSLAEFSSDEGYIVTPAATPQPAISAAPASLGCSASTDPPPDELTVAQQFGSVVDLGCEADHQGHKHPLDQSLRPDLETSSCSTGALRHAESITRLSTVSTTPPGIGASCDARRSPVTPDPSLSGDAPLPEGPFSPRQGSPGQGGAAAKPLIPIEPPDLMAPVPVKNPDPTQRGPLAMASVDPVESVPVDAPQVTRDGNASVVQFRSREHIQAAKVTAPVTPPQVNQAAKVVPPPGSRDPAPPCHTQPHPPIFSPHNSPVLQDAPQAPETLQGPPRAANPDIPAARPRLNQVDHTATLPLPAGAAGRKNSTRIAIGRIEVQINNHPQSVAAPRPAGRFAPQEINLESRFLTRFVIRP